MANVDATLKDVTVTNGSTLDLSQSTYNLGGLLYQASGKIAIVKGATTGVTIENSKFIGKSTNGVTDAMLVCQGAQLYLSVPMDAYILTNNTITLSNTNNYFDELVGNTNPTASTGGIVSITTKTVDAKTIDTGSTCDTYVNQTKNGTTEWVNPNARYYYNLENIFGNEALTDGTVNSPAKLMLWSIRHYAAANLLTYFPAGATNNLYTITNDINMSNYSYYPVDISGDTNINNATITFDNKTIETAETNNKPTTSNTSQHRGMQSGLFRDVWGDLTASNLILSGNIGKAAPLSSNAIGSGALISGTANGKSDTPITLTITNITLKNLYVNSVENPNYNPLFINRINSYTSLGVNGLKTAAETDNGAYSMGEQAYAASSLIGDVGSTTGNGIAATSASTRISVSFNDIRLDARKTKGDLISSYATEQSIFYRATLLDQFSYTSDSSATYNFNEEEDWLNGTHSQNVTYGQEITSSLRNPNNQLYYYNTENYVNASAIPNTTNKTEFTSDKYLPYVYDTKIRDNTLSVVYKEIDVNIKIGHLLNGCGTYGHPYEVETATQLYSLYKYLNGSASNVTGWIVNYNSDKSVLCTSTAPVNEALYQANSDGKWYKGTYVEDTKTFTKDAQAVAIDDATMLAYLRDAYYQVVNDITVSSNFEGLGSSSSTKAFRGVIIGKNIGTTTSPKYPTITIPASNAYDSNFGGLIKVSYGSVVKNINIKYNKQAIVNRTANNTTSLVYFGGVIGDVEGGDNIIDNVNVTYAAEGVKLTGNNTNLITVGGYIGIIKAGGVVFKNMEHTYAGLTTAYDGTNNIYIANEADVQTNPSHYYYANPYVGRVLDGFAVYQGTTTSTAEYLVNTDKNYTIPTLTAPAADNSRGLTFGEFSVLESNYKKNTVTINDAQSMLVMSMIISSGAASYGGTEAKSWSATTEDTYEAAYSSGKVRNASYDDVGAENITSENGDYSVATTYDEVADNALNKYSYLITNYVNSGTSATSLDGKYAARRLTGAYSRFTFKLSSNGEFDLSIYGNGFRGINMRYRTSNTTNVDRNVVSLLGVNGRNKTINVKMNVRQYTADTYSAKAVGFFNFLLQNNTSITTSIAPAKDITLVGTVKLERCAADGTVLPENQTSTEDTVAVGGFAGAVHVSTVASTAPKSSFDNIQLGNDETTLTVYGSSYAGGLLGKDTTIADVKIDTYIKINNCRYNSLTVSSMKSTGGFVGYSGNKTTITSDVNIILQNATLTSLRTTAGGDNANDGVGGVIGTAASSAEITGIKLANLYINSGRTSTDTYGCTKTNVNAGGVVGINKKALILNNIQIYAAAGKTTQIYSGYYGGGLVGSASSSVTSTGCNINGGNNASGKMLIAGSDNIGGAYGNVSSSVSFLDGAVGNGENGYNTLLYGNGKTAGIAGYVGWGRNITVKNATIQNIAVYSTRSAVGGITADLGETGTTVASNFTIKNSAIVSSGSSQAGLVGALSGILSGSNIFWKDNIIQKVKTLSEQDLKAWLESGGALTFVTENQTNAGVWAGSFADKATTSVQLSGVYKTSTDDILYKMPVDVGGVSGNFNDSEKAGFIAYADYTGNLDNTAGSAPYVTTNPGSSVTVYNSEADKTGTLLTGDATVFDGTDKTISVATKIKTDNTNKVTTAYTANTVENFVFSTNIETYEKYIKAGAITTVNLPVFVVDKNDTGSVNEMVTAYLNLLTNGGYSKALTAGAVTAEAISYQWNDTQSRFEAVDAASMAYNNNTFSVASGRYDNNKNQFTLLNVTFGNAYVLQVPVIVKKLVEVKLDVSMLNGAVFNEDPFNANTSRLLAGYGEKFTMQLTYSYYYLWGAYLSSGGTLLWGYDKTVDFNQALPSGTKLTLVDANNKDSAYKATLGSDAKSINLSEFVSVSDETIKWSPTNLNDRLAIKVDPATDGAWMKTTAEEVATLTYNNEGYRLWTETDVDVATRYAVAFNNAETTDGTDPVKERYYLLVETPENKNATDGITINITSTLSSTSANSLPYNMRQPTGDKPTGLLYRAISHLLSDNSGGTAAYKKLNSTGDTVTIKLIDKIECSGGYANTLPDTANRHLQFGVNLNQISNTGSSSFIPPVTANVTFRILDVNDKEINFSNVSSISGTSKQYNTNISAETPELTFIFGSNNTPNDAFNLVNLLKKYNAGQTGDNSYFKVEATIELVFPQKAMAVFPKHTDAAVTGNNNIPPSYTKFASNARISSNASTLISGIKTSALGDTGYYRGEEAGAKLDYNAVGNISQLGINVSNLENNTGTHVIETQGVYDISTADNKEELISKAEKLKCEVKLSYKGGTGDYVPVTTPKSYITISGAGSSSNALTWEIAKGDDNNFGGIYDPTQGTFTLPFDVNVITDIETLNGTYANYQVTLEVKLVGTSETELNTASDYFKYTLARVSTEILRPAT